MAKMEELFGASGSRVERMARLQRKMKNFHLRPICRTRSVDGAAKGR
jgi:hypothetical protein